jgi:hypothetical protein
VILTAAVYDQEHSTHGAALKQLFCHSYYATSSIALNPQKYC